MRILDGNLCSICTATFINLLLIFSFFFAELCSLSVICVNTLLEIDFFAIAKKGSDTSRAFEYQVGNTFVALDLAMEG